MRQKFKQFIAFLGWVVVLGAEASQGLDRFRSFYKAYPQCPNQAESFWRKMAERDCARAVSGTSKVRTLALRGSGSPLKRAQQENHSNFGVTSTAFP